jgi:hypothetical protein
MLLQAFKPGTGYKRKWIRSSETLLRPFYILLPCVQELEKQLQEVKDEFAEYKKEKSENCSMLDADLRRMREELFEAKSQAAKLASHEEYNSEKFKIIQNNCLGYKRQVEALEMRNKQLDLIAAKHEASVSALRDELSKSFNQVSSSSSLFFIFKSTLFCWSFGGMIL